MKKILAFQGSARANGNSLALLNSFIEGAHRTGAESEIVKADEIDLKYCTGCLRCNMVKYCTIRGDQWNDLSRRILEADTLVFASPVYFHHVSAQLKKIIDRFRSFVHVQITETGLIHIPHIRWKKNFVLLLTLGSSSDSDARPVIDLFKFMTTILGDENQLHVITATRLGVVRQVEKSADELALLYPKLGLPVEFAQVDSMKNNTVLESCRALGENLHR